MTDLAPDPVAFWPPHRWLLAVAGGVVALLAIGAIFDERSRNGQPGTALKLTQLTQDTGLTFQPTISNDGALIAYASDRGEANNLNIWLGRIGSRDEPHRLTRHEAHDYQPSFSPDGTQIAFRSERGETGIYVVPTLGGTGTVHRERRPRSEVLSRREADRLLDRRRGPVPSGEDSTSSMRPGASLVSSRPTSTTRGGRSGHPMAATSCSSGSDAMLTATSETTIPACDGGSSPQRAANLGKRAFLAELEQTRGCIGASSSVDAVLTDPALERRRSATLVARNQRNRLLSAIGRQYERLEHPRDHGRALVAGEPVRLTSGAGSEIGALQDAHGRLIFSTFTMNADIWSLPLDPRFRSLPSGPLRTPDERHVDLTILRPSPRMAENSSIRPTGQGMMTYGSEKLIPARNGH